MMVSWMTNSLMGLILAATLFSWNGGSTMSHYFSGYIETGRRTSALLSFWESQARVGVATMKAAPLLSLLVVLRRSWRLNQIMVRTHRLGPMFAKSAHEWQPGRSKFWILTRSSLELWALFELAFWIYCRWEEREPRAKERTRPTCQVEEAQPGGQARLRPERALEVARREAGEGIEPLETELRRASCRISGTVSFPVPVRGRMRLLENFLSNTAWAPERDDKQHYHCLYIYIYIQI